MLRISLLLILMYSFLHAQEITRITVVEDESSQSVPSYNYQGTIYVSLKHLADVTHLSNKILDGGNTLEITFQDVNLRFKSKNPYVIITVNVSGESSICQFPTSSHFINNFIFVPLNETIELLNKVL